MSNDQPKLSINLNAKVNLSQVTEDLKRAKEEIQAKHRAVFADAIGSALQQMPDNVLGVAWNQYIPGFNDGDACTFSLGEISFLVKNDGQFEFDEDTGLYGYDPEDDPDVEAVAVTSWSLVGGYEYVGETYPRTKVAKNPEAEEKYKACIELENFLNASEDLLESVFGADKQIVIKKDGSVEVEYYDCGY
jgi:hypothetical protein